MIQDDHTRISNNLINHSENIHSLDILWVTDIHVNILAGSLTFGTWQKVHWKNLAPPALYICNKGD